jgi:hypothetical protein
MRYKNDCLLDERKREKKESKSEGEIKKEVPYPIPYPLPCCCCVYYISFVDWRLATVAPACLLKVFHSFLYKKYINKIIIK